MVPGPSFYIYGGGRWREVDVSTGRIEGWGRARFAYIKRGKVHQAKTRHVLSGLRDLKVGQKSTVKDGGRLPFKNLESPEKRDNQTDTFKNDNSHGCQRSSYNRCPPKTSVVRPATVKSSGMKIVTKSDAAIQVSLSKTMPGSSQKSDKKLNKNASPNDDVPSRITTTAMVHSDPNKLAKLKLKKQWSVAGSDKPQKKKVPRLKLSKCDSSKYDFYKRKRSGSESSVWVVLPKADTELINNNKHSADKTKQLKRRRQSTSSESNHKKPQKIVRSKSMVDTQPKNYAKKIKYAPKAIKHNHKNEIQPYATSSDDSALLKSKVNNVTVNTEKGTEEKKELFINEEDVELLRNYLLHNESNFDLLKFDESNEYKINYFYGINPLVNLTRCPMIARMLRRESQSEISLEDFASQLGLTSNKERKVPQRYKMRKRDLDKDIDRPENESEKENSKNRVNKDKHKDLDRSEYESGEENMGTNKRSTRKSQIVSSDSETDTDFEEDGRKSTVNTRSKVAPKPKRYLRSKKDENRQSDLTEIISLKQKTSKSDGDYTDNDSSAVEVTTRSVRKRKNVYYTSSSDADKPLKSSKKSQNDKINNSVNKSKVTDIDLTESSNEDSEWISDTEGIKSNQKTKLIKRKNANTDTNNGDKEMGSMKKVINRRKSVNSNKQSDYQTDSDEEHADVSTNVTKSPLKRTKRGQFLKRNTIEKDFVDENPKTVDKSSKTRKNDDTNVNRSQTNESSEKAFKSNAKSKTRNKSDMNKNNNNKSNNSVQSEDDTEKAFEEFKNRRLNKNNSNNKNNKTNDRNVNMTASDEHSEREQCVKKTKTTHKPRTNINVSNNLTEKPSESSEKNKFSKTVSKNKHDDSQTMRYNSDSDVFVAPVIGEVRSLAVQSQPKRPPSTASSMCRVEYSNLEDQAIVSWLSLGGRARCVNGNRIWRDLQDQYTNITGQSRTWQSLRNRYLRSILPRLGSLSLNPSLVSRLRAAAAMGEIKPQKGPSRRNSIFGAPPVGALSRRVRAARSPSTEPEPPPKKHKHDHTRKLPQPSSRQLRSSQESSPVKSVRLPRYSEITRHFAAKHRESTPISPETQKAEKNSLENKKSEKNSLETKKAEKTSLETKKSEKNSLETKKAEKNSLETNKAEKTSLETKKAEKSSLETKKSGKNSLETKKSEKTSLETKKFDKISLETKMSDKSSVKTRMSVRKSLDAQNVSNSSTDIGSSTKNTPVLRSQRKISKDSSETMSSNSISVNLVTDKLATKNLSETNSLDENSIVKRLRRKSVRDLSPAKGQTKTRRLYNPHSII